MSVIVSTMLSPATFQPRRQISVLICDECWKGEKFRMLGAHVRTADATDRHDHPRCAICYRLEPTEPEPKS